MFLSRNDPLMSLNYAIFLYNTGDKAAAARQFHNFEKRYQVVANTDMDPEVTKRLCFFIFLKFYSCSCKHVILLSNMIILQIFAVLRYAFSYMFVY